MKEYYKDGKLSFSFDGKREGYWLGIDNMSYFIDSRVYEEIKNLKGLELFDELEDYNFSINYKMQKEKILPSNLENMFSEVDKKLEAEFEEFKKQNDL